MDEIARFANEVKANIQGLRLDTALRESSLAWLTATLAHRYSYNFSSLGRPIIQYPQDIVALQELIWEVKPDLIIETGIAHGGSLVLSASMLALLDYCDAVGNGTLLDPRATRRRVLGVDIDIRSHNRAAILSHPMSHHIRMIEGSSVSAETILQVHEAALDHDRVMVILDSNHTHEHVLAELEAYAPLTSPGSYCIVFDTIIEDLPASQYPDRPWGKGNNPKTAVREYLHQLQGEEHFGKDGTPLSFSLDSSIQEKLLITVGIDGYLKRDI